MDFDSVCNTGLALGLGFSPAGESSTNDERSKKRCLNSDHLAKAAIRFEPLLTMGLSGETCDKGSRKVDENKVCINQFAELYRQDSGASSRLSEEDHEGSNGRKKLRLTKAQSALLEESFKQYTTLNPKQKQELARELKLRPRQVEVWFQNRRARTKLKQTEADLEYLKKWCETLTDENRRLEKELQELKAIKVGVGRPLYMQLPAAALTMCPSCERIGDNNSETPFTMPPKPHFYNSFTNPSPAC